MVLPGVPGAGWAGDRAVHDQHESGNRAVNFA
jgi:hypothetical protein